MERLPFEIVSLEESKIWLSSLSIKEMIGLYLVMLNATGWSRIDYEKELLKKIDTDWATCFSN